MFGQEIINLECPNCKKWNIKAIENKGYLTSRKGFVGKRVNIWHDSNMTLLTDQCPDCGTKVKKSELL